MSRGPESVRAGRPVRGTSPGRSSRLAGIARRIGGLLPERLTRPLGGRGASGDPEDPTRRGTIVQRLRVFVLDVVARLVWLLPEPWLFRLADLAGALWYRAAPERAALGRRQLGRVCRALDERGTGSPAARAAANDPDALERLVRSAFRHAARYYLEVIRTARLSPARVRDRVLVETPDVVDEAFREPGPIIFVAAHFGAIELPALYLAQRSGRPVTGPMEAVGDRELQRWFIRTRSAVGVRIVGLREARRELLAALRRREIVGLIADRDITGGGLHVPLFGHPAPLPVGPALLAVESGAPVYLAAVRRDGPGRYRGRLARIELPTDGSRRERVEATVRAIAAGFETAIADAPEQWWGVFHPIWPDLAEPADDGGTGRGAVAATDGPAADADPGAPATTSAGITGRVAVGPGLPAGDAGSGLAPRPAFGAQVAGPAERAPGERSGKRDPLASAPVQPADVGR